MKYIIKYILFILIFVAPAQVSIAQTTLQVVTRELKQEYTFSNSDNLIIRAEKGIIDINVWKENKVKVIVKIIVKNKVLEIAKKELAYIDWNSYHKNSVLQLYNTINLPKNASLQSIVRVEYLIWMPEKVNFSIQNSFGQVQVKDVNCNGKIELQYCDLILENTTGNITVNSKVGDIKLNNPGSDFKLTSQYSSIQLINPVGNITLNTTYGETKIYLQSEFKSLNITAERSNVSVTNKKCNEFKFNLISNMGNLTVNESCYVFNKTFLKKTTEGTEPNTKKTISYLNPTKTSLLTIKTNFGDISLE